MKKGQHEQQMRWVHRTRIPRVYFGAINPASRCHCFSNGCEQALGGWEADQICSVRGYSDEPTILLCRVTLGLPLTHPPSNNYSQAIAPRLLGSFTFRFSNRKHATLPCILPFLGDPVCDARCPELLPVRKYKLKLTVSVFSEAATIQRSTDSVGKERRQKRAHMPTARRPFFSSSLSSINLAHQHVNYVGRVG